MHLCCFDFDGVICDSAVETASTGWYGAAELWPDDFADSPPADFIAAFRRLRPVIETGFESILLARLIRRGVSETAILADFQGHVRRLMTDHDLDRDDLVARFSRLRDEWLAERPDQWLALHEFYAGVPGTVARLQREGHPVFIITTKQQRYAMALCRRAGIELPAEQVFGLEAGKKRRVLADLLARDEFASATCHFIEDRIKTLRGVAEDPDLVDVRLYFAPWGYATEEDLAAAEAMARVTILELDTFPEWTPDGRS